MRENRLVLVGAGDHGRGVLEIIRRLQEVERHLDVVGFVDDGVEDADVHGVPVLGNGEWLCENLHEVNARVVLSLADPAAKERLASLLDSERASYRTLVHPQAVVAPSVRLAEGVIVNAGAIVVYDADVGPHVTVNLQSTIGHHVHIGAYSTIAPGARILGHAQVGERCEVHSNAVILPSVSIGDDVVVGAGSVVLRDVPAGTTVFGVPARAVPRTTS